MNNKDNRSIEELTQAIELNPTDANIHFSRGHAYHTKDNYDKAIADYTKAIQLKSNLTEAYNNRGAAHSKKGDYNRAIKDLNKAIQLKPNLAKAYNNRGAAHGRKGEYSKAIADLNKAIQLNPNFAVAYYNRGIAYANKGDDNQANADFTKEKELRNWNVKIENLINQLRNLASQPSIDRSALDTCEATYSQLMEMHQTRKLPEQTLQQINEYYQEFMDGRQKLIDRERFSNLSAKAMNPNVATCFPLPELEEHDLRLVEKWHNLPQNSLDRLSLIKDKSEDWELGRLLSARSAEKVAADFYRHYRKKVEDISITQIDENKKSEWEKYDLYVDKLPIDVKNSRQSRKNPERYTEHCIPRFKHNREKQEVAIAGVFSPYLWAFELLDKPVEHHQNREIQFLGQTTRKRLQALKNEFKDLVDFGETNSTGIHFLPPWVFDYPEYVYTDRDKALKELKDFPGHASLKGATFKFNLYPVSITVGIDLTEILGDEASEEWEQRFLHQLRNRIEKYGLSLPFLFLTILDHFLCMADSSKTVSNFEPSKYRKFLFCEEFDKPLGIYDPLKTIHALINVLGTLWTAKNGLIRKFHVFKLRSFNILWGKPNSNENLWTTLIAYCGECGKNPLVLGKSERCKEGRLICPDPDCGFCCRTCRGEDQAEALENAY